MVEQWNPVSSYDLYWQECAPIYCTYFKIVRAKNFVGVVVTMISMVGGLIAALRLITPPIINFLSNLFKPTVKRPEQGNY